MWEFGLRRVKDLEKNTSWETTPTLMWEFGLRRVKDLEKTRHVQGNPMQGKAKGNAMQGTRYQVPFQNQVFQNQVLRRLELS